MVDTKIENMIILIHQGIRPEEIRKRLSLPKFSEKIWQVANLIKKVKDIKCKCGLLYSHPGHCKGHLPESNINSTPLLNFNTTKNTTTDIKFYSRKFTIEQVKEIKKSLSKGVPVYNIARNYNCSQGTINKIQKGIRFRYVEEDRSTKSKLKECIKDSYIMWSKITTDRKLYEIVVEMSREDLGFFLNIEKDTLNNLHRLIQIYKKCFTNSNEVKPKRRYFKKCQLKNLAS